MDFFKRLYSKYGAFIFITLICVVAKVALFYHFMGVTANFVIIVLITLTILYLIFDIFNNKWIPAVLYLLLSVLMFADVSYSSFFNRYLSINLLGAADLLVDVSASIKEIIKPKFFLLFVDNVMMFATLVYGKKHLSSAVEDSLETVVPSIGEIESEEELQPGIEIELAEQLESDRVVESEVLNDEADPGAESENAADEISQETESEDSTDEADPVAESENAADEISQETEAEDSTDEAGLVTELGDATDEAGPETELGDATDEAGPETEPDDATDEAVHEIQSEDVEDEDEDGEGVESMEAVDKISEESKSDDVADESGNEIEFDVATDDIYLETESDDATTEAGRITESDDIEVIDSVVEGVINDKSEDAKVDNGKNGKAKKNQNGAGNGKKKKSGKGKNKTQSKSKHLHQAVKCLLIISMIGGLVTNVTNSYAVMSVNNQEIFSYYTKDLLQYFGGMDFSMEPAKSEVEVYTGTYESQIDGPLFGEAEGRNLIVIQVESFQNFVIGAEYNGKELTPNLNKLLQDDTIYFDNYYQQVSTGNTSDAEYATNNGLYGSAVSYTYKNYQDNYFRGLPVLLKEKYGYTTAAFHAYEKDYWNRVNAYPAQGFDTFYSSEDFSTSDMLGMGLSDEKWFEESVEYMTSFEQPFYSFMITLSNHHPFYLPAEYTDIDVLPEDMETNFGHYVQSVNYTDYAIGCFIQDLKNAGLYDNSVICIYGDHHGLTADDAENVESMENYLGGSYSYEEMMNIPLFIHIPGEDVTQTVSVIGGQTDFMPTVAYLLGFQTLDTLYTGQNLLTAESGFVCELYYLPKGSYFDDDTAFIMSGDGVFYNSTAYNRKTGETIPVESCMPGYTKALSQLNSAEYYLRNNVLDKLYNQGDSGNSILGTAEFMERPEIIANAGAPDKNLAGTNSLEALNASYDSGYRCIKVDLSWTTDGRTVLLSDWDDTGEYLETDTVQTTYEEYMSLEMKNGLTSMDFAMLAEWMSTHEDAYIAVDLKKDMSYLLQSLESYYPQIKDRIIPVFSNISEYNRGDLMGFENSIFQINEDSEYTESQISTFISMTNLWAVSLPLKQAGSKYKSVLDDCDYSYVYDVDSATEQTKYNDIKADGFFTNVIARESSGERQ
jgi:lipoteichoic acid synthase